MAPTTSGLRRAAALLLALALVGYLLAGGLFRAAEAIAICASCACAYLCIAAHYAKRRPESIVIAIAGAIFIVAYIAQAVLFLKLSRSTATSLSEAISIRSIFSLAALGAGPKEIQVSLEVILSGFLGILAPAAYFAWAGKRSGRAAAPADRLIVSNPITLGYAAIVCTLVFGFLRKYFGLESPVASGLPMGIGGMINIASAYIGPNLSFAAFFFALHQDNLVKARRLALLSIALGLYNYVLFTSKLSLVFPALFLLASQHLLRRQVLSTRALLMLGAVFVVVYPFLNLYRSAIALGVAPGDLLAAIAKMYASQADASEFKHSAVELALSAMLGRFVGYDPLMILLQAHPYPGSVFEYVLHGNVDKFLTYEILDFQDPMGYSPGFLGRLYYISGSYTFVMAMTALTVSCLATLVRWFWRGDIRLRFMAPLLLTYCLIFFTDGIRLELFRSLAVSTLLIYFFMRLTAKTRVGHHIPIKHQAPPPAA